MTDRAPIHDGRSESSIYGCVTCGLSVADHDNACRDGNGCTYACARRHAARDPDYAAYLQSIITVEQQEQEMRDRDYAAHEAAEQRAIDAWPQTAESAAIERAICASFVPPDEVLLAQRDAALDALERLVHAFPELTTCLSTPPQQRALRAAMSLLADAGRGST